MITQALVNHFNKMVADNAPLYVTDTDKDEMWNVYLNAFLPENNGLYRIRQIHDCSACRQFIKAIGNVVTIAYGAVVSIWDFISPEDEYKAPLEAMSAYVRSKPIVNVFYSPFAKIGIPENRELIGTDVIRYEHFAVTLPAQFVRSNGPTLMSERKSQTDVFARAMEELSKDSILTVLELIQSNTLYKGLEWKTALETLLTMKNVYDAQKSDMQRNTFLWNATTAVGPAISKIKNHSIGVLLKDITEGMDLDSAVRRYEKIVAPESYKRPKAIYTEAMLEAAKKTVQELGYENSLARRYAHVDDIEIDNILFVDRDVAPSLKGADVFADMQTSIGKDQKKFDKLDEVPLDRFLAEVLPSASELEVFFENKHATNMVSLLTAANADSKSMFKWSNPFSWAYTGNIADSTMKEQVKSAGGAVDGILRFSIMWNHGTIHNQNDLDAHCVEPEGYRIYFGTRGRKSPTGGILDVDIIRPANGTPAVENISWLNAKNMIEGEYKFYVHCYSYRGGHDGFEAEIEVDGIIHKFAYTAAIKQSEHVHIATVKYSKADGFTVISKIPSTASARELWGMTTQNFIPVSMVMKSPNAWNGDAIGHEHLFFMLKGCQNPESPNGFYNEFLKQELAVHRNVFEALGSRMRVDESSASEQLSGVGFSLTKRADIVVKVKSATM